MYHTLQPSRFTRDSPDLGPKSRFPDSPYLFHRFLQLLGSSPDYALSRSSLDLLILLPFEVNHHRSMNHTPYLGCSCFLCYQLWTVHLKRRPRSASSSQSGKLLELVPAGKDRPMPTVIPVELTSVLDMVESMM